MNTHSTYLNPRTVLPGEAGALIGALAEEIQAACTELAIALSDGVPLENLDRIKGVVLRRRRETATPPERSPARHVQLRPTVLELQRRWGRELFGRLILDLGIELPSDGVLPTEVVARLEAEIDRRGRVACGMTW